MLRLQGTLPFLRLEWRFLLFGLLLAFWSGPGQTYVISVIGGHIRNDFGLSNGEFGGIYTVATLCCAALLWKAGPLVDRLPLKSFVLKIGLLMVAAMIAFGFVQGPISLFFGIIGIRFLGQGMMTHVALTAMARRYEVERGRAIAIAALGFPLGEALFPPLIVLALGFVDWRMIWPGMAILAAITLLPGASFLIRHTSHQDGSGAAELQAADDDAKNWTRAEMLSDRKFYLLLPTAMAQAAIITGLFFHQVYFISLKGWDFETWSLSFVIFAIASLVGGMMSGVLVDMFRARRLVSFVLIPMSLGILIFAFLEAQIFAGVVMFFLGVGAGSTNPVLSSLWPELYGTRHLGAIRSVATVVMVFGSALGPVFMGFALDAGASLEAIVLVSVLITLLAAIMAKIALSSRVR